jgi:hypothetical protein
MFRQVVMQQFVEGTSAEEKDAFRAAVERLREIPELLAMTYGDDAGHFEGNFDFVVVSDFADFESARRYVAHPIHQAYVTEHAMKIIGNRVVVQHDWTPPSS